MEYIDIYGDATRSYFVFKHCRVKADVSFLLRYRYRHGQRHCQQLHTWFLSCHTVKPVPTRVLVSGSFLGTEKMQYKQCSYTKGKNMENI